MKRATAKGKTVSMSTAMQPKTRVWASNEKIGEGDRKLGW